MEIKVKCWEESYKRKENFLFYPKEEVVKFLNRYIRKRFGIDEFTDLVDDFSRYEKVRALDFGCGIGRQTILLQEFGTEAYGIDISEEAIKEAKALAEYFGFNELKERFQVFDGYHIPFDNHFFQISISEGVLDSMYFNVAKTIINELDRVTTRYLFLSLISGDNDQFYREFESDIEVEEKHEQGTIQSYYNYSKILNLIEKTNFKIEWIRLITEEGINHRYKYGRYYIVLKK